MDSALKAASQLAHCSGKNDRDDLETICATLQIAPAKHSLSADFFVKKFCYADRPF